jgi:hypothetical protein
LIDSELNRQGRRHGQLDGFDHAAFEFAARAQQLRIGVGFDTHNDGGVCCSKELGNHGAGHSGSQIIGLDSSQDEVRTAILLDGFGERTGRCKLVGALEGSIKQMNRAVRTHRQSSAQHASRLLATHRKDHDFAAVFFFESQRFLERVIIRFACDKGQVLNANPGFGFINNQSGRGIGNRLDAADYFHSRSVLALLETLTAIKHKRHLSIL